MRDMAVRPQDEEDLSAVPCGLPMRGVSQLLYRLRQRYALMLEEQHRRQISAAHCRHLWDVDT
jgi:hypothetical protein